eukprot:TRINITY_DN11455_c0_g1_i1.p1 TRINITY_DN11455_c0_g1~~TRINITY_DN11455_c0_g1_i1.p1  ORF type:complete len:137 (+),score=14.68 TRINITY_DN11455_c0_g1_i1:73-483(+)
MKTHEDWIKTLGSFLSKLREDGDENEIKWSSYLLFLVEKSNSIVVTFNEAPSPSMRLKRRPKSLLDINPSDIARALTMVDFKIFKRINLSEFHKQGWLSRDNNKSPNISLLISRFNMLLGSYRDIIAPFEEASKNH